MKKFILSALIAFGFVGTIVAQEYDVASNHVVSSTSEDDMIHLNWEPTFKDALSKAKQEKKAILIYFTGSDWCGPCMRLDESLFHTEKFKKFADENMVLYMANYPQNRDLVTAENRTINQQLSERYAQTSFPTIIMVNDKGEVLGRKNGSYMAEYYYPFFDETISRIK